MIELDIFSGRSNPRWEAGPETLRLLAQLEAALKPAREAQPEPPALGYRGFIYTQDGDPIRAFAGFVRRGDVMLADPGLSIERALVAAMPGEFDPIRARVSAELARHG